MTASGGGTEEPQEEARSEAAARAPAARRIGRFAASAVGLVALIALVVAAQSLLRPRVTRAPVEFLPTETRLAVGVDLRPDGPAMKKMRAAWRDDDIAYLSRRAVDLAQEAVDWTGLKLDLRKEAAPWYGGRLAAGALPGVERPTSAVLVVSASNLRRARASMDQAVAPMAKDLEWRRSRLRQAGGRLTVWRNGAGKDEVAYAAVDGCLVVASTAEGVERCLAAARDKRRRLAEQESFRRAAGRVPEDAVLWVHLDPGLFADAAHFALPAMRQGWAGVLKEYLRSAGGRRGPGRGPGAEAPRALAMSVAPERDGVRLSGIYWRGRAGKEAASAAHLEKLAALLPKETAAYLLVHDLGRWLRAPGREGAAPGGSGVPLPFGFWPGLTRLPEDLLVAALRRPEGKQPAVVVAARSDEMTAPLQSLVGMGLRGSASGQVGEFTVIAGDAEALRQCERAAKEAAERLSPLRGEGSQFEIWVRPEALVGPRAEFVELWARGWQSPEGGEGELVLRARPRLLLGGR